ncbi:MAG: response regulator transcription factor [Phaeodactylibacter sp.]|nr:response regulator transcription factor [Phaeodactylibacter sp.]MCB9274981.1 response regulator transcription factor [Lewinellaceae bacterium]
MIRVFIVDDHPMVVEGIRALLQDEAQIEMSGSAPDAFAALEAIRGDMPDVVLLDINLPEVSGLELCRRLRQEFPGLHILGMSTFKERSYISRMINEGALGYVLKSASKEEIVNAITLAAAGRAYINEEALQALAAPPQAPTPMLTSREKEVLACIAEGLTNKEIAARLFISPLTVDSHRKNLLAKFGAGNTAALIRLAVEQGLV